MRPPSTVQPKRLPDFPTACTEPLKVFSSGLSVANATTNPLAVS